MQWDAPADEGGAPLSGYTIYLDSVLYFNSSHTESTLNEYTFTSLTVGRTYTIGISGRNEIGEGSATTISLLAASLPP